MAGLLDNLIYKALGGDKIRGSIGEKRIRRKLSKLDGVTLCNMYVPKADGAVRVL